MSSSPVAKTEPCESIKLEHYHSSIEKGRSLYEKLSAPIRTDRIELIRIEQHYLVTTGNRAAPGDIHKYLENLHVEPSDFVYKDVQSKDMASNDSAAYINRFNVRNGVILCIENNKILDENPASTRLWPSEILWQYWRQAATEAGGIKTNRLRFIVRHCVVNESARIAIWQAARLSTVSHDEFPDLGHKVYEPPDDGFYAILGSVNGASMMRMLLDHKSQIGYRTIERVVVLPVVDFKDLSDFGKSRTFIVELSDIRHLRYPPMLHLSGPVASRIPLTVFPITKARPQ